MRGLNKITLIGHLGKDPEVRELPDQFVAHTTLATTETFRTKSEELKAITDWHNLVFWGRLALFARDYLTRGRLIYVEGKSRTRHYEDATGIRRYVTEVIVDQVILLDSK